MKDHRVPSRALPLFQPHERPDARAPEDLRSPGDLGDAINACVRCPLSDDRVQVVPGQAPDGRARLLLLGGAPGRSDSLAGRPFSGAAGNVVDRALADVGMSRDDVLLTTVVKCRPPSDREPTELELETCHPWLLEQVAVHRPDVVVALGDLAVSTLLRRRVTAERLSGHVLRVWDDVPLVTTRDPLEVVRGNATAASAIRRDLATAVRLLASDGPTGGAASDVATPA